jgi:hypothetical protein
MVSLFVALLAGVVVLTRGVIRREYVATASQLLDVQVVQRDHTLRVDGFISDSGMRVTRSTTQRVGDRLLVRVYRAPVRDTDDESVRRGDFHALVVITDDISAVQIGDSDRFVTLGEIGGLPIRIPWNYRNDVARTIWIRR